MQKQELIRLATGPCGHGFFANAYLLDFDASVVALFGKHPRGYKWRVLDYCRYVDDMRFVVDLEDHDLASFESDFKAFLKGLLEENALAFCSMKRKPR